MTKKELEKSCIDAEVEYDRLCWIGEPIEKCQKQWEKREKLKNKLEEVQK